MKQVEFRITGINREQLRGWQKFRRTGRPSGTTHALSTRVSTGTLVVCAVVAVVVVAVIEQNRTSYIGATLGYQPGIIWGNNTATVPPELVEINIETGAVIKKIKAPNAEAAASKYGRGILVLGTTVYYTVGDNGKVFVTNSETQEDLGVLFDTHLSGIGALAWDGAHFWVSAYDPRKNVAQEYDAQGNRVREITLQKSEGNYDGLEIVEGRIIANEFDGADRSPNTYDVYDGYGVLRQEGFITTRGEMGKSYHGTGIAFDGTQYVVSAIDENALLIYARNGAFVKELPLLESLELEDLSPVIQVGKSNLLENGSFEDGQDPGGYLTLQPGSTVIRGWVVTRASIDYIGSYFPSSDGKRCLDLDGTPGFGGIRQTFPTIPGRTYHVRFDLAGNPQGPPRIKRMRIEAGGQSQEFTHDASLNWTTQTWDFTAHSSSTTLEFYSLDTEGGECGPLLDNVSVTE